jgi:hypothetical protein
MGAKFMFDSTRSFLSFAASLDLGPDIGMAALSHATQRFATNSFLALFTKLWEVEDTTLECLYRFDNLLTIK